MRILAIETSCDDTSIALVEKSENKNLVKVLNSEKALSEDLYKQTGGIVPEMAARQQAIFLIPVLKKVLKNFEPSLIDAIAVTVGPGLIGSLLIGVETARSLAYAWDKPLIPVNHLLGHLYANWINKDNNLQEKNNKNNAKAPDFPAVGLVVSGGHTDLVLIKSHKNIKFLGGTRDDAAGECFDKCARIILDADYPGGPKVATQADNFSGEKMEEKFYFPRPMINDESLEMSFSGLKTAVYRKVSKMINKSEKKKLTERQKSWLCFELQNAIVDVLISKVVKSLEKYRPKSFLLGGGVAANLELRKRLKEIKDSYKIEVFIPGLEFCMDNAEVIGARGIFSDPKSIFKVYSNPVLKIDN